MINDIPTLNSLKEELTPSPNTTLAKACQTINNEIPKIVEKIREAYTRGDKGVIYPDLVEECNTPLETHIVLKTLCEILKNKGYKAEIYYFGNTFCYNGIKIFWD